MSKGNMLLGYARGKVGSLVFSRRKGEQITRARNTRPANPRSPLQLQQRMKMYAPVQFYKSSIATQFKYAFEDQKANETPFNAFMRHNISDAPWVSKTLANAYAPIPFPAKMSDGSVSSVDTFIGDVKLEPTEGSSVTNWAVGIMADDSFGGIVDNGTVSEFTYSVLTMYPSLKEGDMLTFIAVRSAGLSIENGDVLYNGVDTFNFSYAQVVLSTSDSTDLSSLGLRTLWQEGQSGAPKGIGLIGGDAPFNQELFAGAGCIIVSRKVGERIVTSTSVLQLNDHATEIYSLMRTTGYRDKSALTYKVGEEALLDPTKID